VGGDGDGWDELGDRLSRSIGDPRVGGGLFGGWGVWIDAPRGARGSRLGGRDGDGDRRLRRAGRGADYSLSQES
jgi:hypothetical protein